MTAAQRLKGIILAGGSGSRLHPVTRGISKQLLPVYDKPMVYYPLSTLMLAGIRDVLVITTPHEQELFKRLLGDGASLGLSIEYAVSRSRRGWRRRSSSAATSSAAIASRSRSATTSSTARTCPITCGRRRHAPPAPPCSPIGSATRSATASSSSTPAGTGHRHRREAADPKSPFAVTGLYFYDNQVLDIAASLKPSARGELEITDVNREYLERGALHVEQLARGIAWLDTGTHASLTQASSFIQAIEERQGLMVACLEEIAYHMHYITAGDLGGWRGRWKRAYGQYLLQVLEEDGG